MIGSNARPLASARCSSCRDRLLHRRRLHARCLDDDVRGQRRARERLLHPVVRLDRPSSDFGNESGPLGREAELERRRGERQQHAPASDRRERRPAQDAVDDRAPDPAFAVVAAEAADERDATRSTLSPSRESTAGSTVSEPSTATATTRIVASASEAKVGSPVRNMPAIATITVRPEMSTERPEVAAATSSAARSLRPAARSWRSRFK